MSGKVAILLAAAALAVGTCTAGCRGRGRPTIAPAPLSYPVQRYPWSFAGKAGEKQTTEHYRIFTTTTNRALRNAIGGFLEAAWSNYVALTGLDAIAAKDERLSVYLFGSRKEWALLTTKITGPAAETYLKVQNGGYYYAGVCVYWDIGTMPTYSVAAHEGMHQFLHYATRQSLPIWAEEGLAVQAEGYLIRNDDDLVYFRPGSNNLRLTTLRQTILARRWRPASRLVAMSAAANIQESGLHAAEYYSQLWALLTMIRNDQRYAAGLRRMLRDAAEGRLHKALGIGATAWAKLQRNARAYTEVVGPKAFAHYIDPDMDRFEQRYEAFARELAEL